MRTCIYKLSKFTCNIKTWLELNWVCRSQSAKEYVVFLNRQKDKDFALVSNLFSFWQLTSIFSEYKTNAIKNGFWLCKSRLLVYLFRSKLGKRIAASLDIRQLHTKGLLKEENQRCREIRRLVSLKKKIKFGLTFPNVGLKKKKKIKQTHLKQVWQKAKGYEWP